MKPDADSSRTFYLQLAKWSTVGNGFAFVYLNDLYYQPSARSPIVHRITESNAYDVYNGVPDWLYEGELSCNGLPDQMHELSPVIFYYNFTVF